MPDALEVAHTCQHGQNGFNQHTVVPKATSADLQVRRVALFLVEVRVRQHQHLSVRLGNQRLELTVVGVCGFASPGANQPKAVEHQAQLAAYDPAMVGAAFLADLVVAAPHAPRVQKLDAEAVRHAQQRRLCQEAGHLVLVSGLDETGAFSQVGLETGRPGHG